LPFPLMLLKVISGGYDHTIRIWSVLGEQERVLDCGRPIDSVAFSPGGQRVACGLGRDVEIWSLYGKKEQVLKGQKYRVTSVSFSPDGQYIGFVALDSTVRVWSPSCQQKRIFHGHTDPVLSVVFSPDGQHVASGSSDKTVRVWSLSTTQTRNVNSHTMQITSIGFTGDGKNIISASDDSIRVWSIFGEHQKVFNVRGRAAVSKDGQHIAFHVDDRTLRIKSVFGRHMMNIPGDYEFCQSIGFSDDGQWVRSSILWGNDIILSINTGKKAESNTIAFNDENDVDNDWYDLGNQLIWLPSYLQGKVWKNGDLVVLGGPSGAMAICHVNEVRLDSHPI